MSDFNLQTPAAKVAPKIQYTNLMFSSFFKFVEICGGPDPTPNIQKKIEILTGVLINFIPNPDERTRLKEKRRDKINEIKTAAKKIRRDADDVNDDILEVNIDIVGEVMELCDDFLAIMERQSVMATMDNEELMRLESKYYPEGLPKPKKATYEDVEDEVTEEV